MSTTFPLRVLKINEPIFEGEAVSVTAPGSSGELTILAKHETMLSSLQGGEIRIHPKEGGEVCVEIDHGFIEATPNMVTVLL